MACYPNMRSPLIMAHRGGAGLFPENTLYAFRQAVTQFRADVIETDIHLTRDGEIIAFHDRTVDRITNSTGLVREMTLKEIKELDAGWHFTLDGGKTYPFRGKGLTVPTLRETFTEFKDDHVGINIEIKQTQRYMEQKLYNLIVGMGMTDRVLVNAPRPCASSRFNKLNKRGVCTGANAYESVKAFTLTSIGLGSIYVPKADALQLPLYFHGIRVVTDKLVSLCREKDIKLHVWTINEVSDMEMLIKMGVDGIVTDYPDRLYDIIRVDV